MYIHTHNCKAFGGLNGEVPFFSEFLYFPDLQGMSKNLYGKYQIRNKL